MLSSLLLRVAGVTVVACVTAVACIQTVAVAGVLLVPDGGLPAIAVVPGVVDVSAVPFEHSNHN